MAPEELENLVGESMEECPHCNGSGRVPAHRNTIQTYIPCMHTRRITDTGGTRCLDCGYLFPMEWSRD